MKFRLFRMLALLSVLSAGVAQATSVSLSITGTSTVTATDPTHYSYTASGTATATPYGQSTFSSSGQVLLVQNGNGNSVQGTFTLDFGSGDTLTGTFIVPTAIIFPQVGGSLGVNGSAAITGGTGRFLGAVGSFPTVGGNGTATAVNTAAFTLTANGDVTTPGSGGSSALRFVSITPCRVVDTRNPAGPFGGPSLGTPNQRDFGLPFGTCGIPVSALAYSLNVTVVPHGPLSYLTIWPTGQTQPLVSTLNSLDGRIKANAAIVPAGTSGSVSVFATDPTDVVLDVNGYFVPASSGGNLSFYPVAPCRVADTRMPAGSFGGPSMSPGSSRTFLVTQTCGIPAYATAYSLNMTVVPTGPLGFLTVWPTGQARPFVSTLNAPTGEIVANAAIIPAGTNEGIDVYTTNQTDLVIDINGYFAQAGLAGALSFYTATPCRLVDTRLAVGTFGGPSFGSSEVRNFPLRTNPCGVPTTAQAYSLNATVVPKGALAFLTLWPSNQAQPSVSTLNAPDASITSNAAIVPAGPDGAIFAYPFGATDLILDYNGYFAP